MNLQRELFRVVDAFNTAGIEYAVCGGLAVAIHGYPRATQDIDVLIQKSQLDAAVRSIESIGYVIPAGLIPFKTGTEFQHEVFRVSRMTDGEVLSLDLMLVAPVFETVWAERQMVRLSGRQLCVVSRSGLAKMKRLAGRYKDLADLEGLGLVPEDDDEKRTD